MRRHLSLAQRFFLLCMLAGILCGLAAVCFHLAIDWLFGTVFGKATELLGSADGFEGKLRFAAFMTLTPAFGGLLVGLALRSFAKQSVGSGIPQTKIAYYRKFGLIRFREAINRFLLGTIFIGTGNSLGREGPTVHMCAAIASWVGQVFGLARARIQAMVPVGMAAGVAAGFNAPLSAITFVFEELLSDFSTKALGGIVVAVVVAAAIERSIIGEHPIFETSLPHFESAWWMLIAIPLGVTAALLGHLFVGVLLQLRQRIKQQGRVPDWLKPALGGLAVGALASTIYLWTGQNGVFSIGYTNLTLTMGENPVLWVFLVLFVAKFIATLISYTFGGSGGLFSPILVCGGMLGACFGILCAEIFELPAGVELREVVGACTLLGMGAFFAAAIRCPFTSILIIFEMTLNYSLILPLMAGNILAYFISTRLRPVPVYDSLLLQDGLSLRTMPNYRGKQDYHHLPVSSIMTFDTLSIEESDTPAEALEKIKTKHHAYPVLDPEGLLSGVITHHELEEEKARKSDLKIRDMVGKRLPITVNPDASIRDVARTLVIEDVLQAPVVSRTDSKRLIGIITLHDIARAQNAIEEGLGRD